MRKLYKLKRKVEDVPTKTHLNILARVKCVLSQMDCFSRLFLKSLKQQFDFNKACQLVLEYT